MSRWCGVATGAVGWVHDGGGAVPLVVVLPAWRRRDLREESPIWATGADLGEKSCLVRLTR